jgi:alanyl-tRNA synthetase
VDTTALREGFQQFFEARGHKRMHSARLIPENDSTVLFTSAGMQALSPFFMGKQHPLGSRLVSVQKCLRTDGIEKVGDAKHLTFFEMLGNWSIRDYFKKETLTWSYEFLTQVLSIPHSRIGVTVFAGDEDAPRDEESADIWRQLGVSGDQVRFRSRAHNWWGPAGVSPPCGPDPKIFIDSGRPTHAGCGPGCPCGKWLEMWDNVFLEYVKTPEGRFEKVWPACVDTGMGVEAALVALNGLDDVYKLETLAPIVARIETLSSRKYADTPKPFRVIVDHVRAATFAIADGARPSNVEAGYIIRRLVRRAVRFGQELSISRNFCSDVAGIVIDIFGQAYPELEENRAVIGSVLESEEEKFKRTLGRGLRECTKVIERTRAASASIVAANDAFNLYESFGFPLSLTAEIARENGLGVNEAAFENLLEEHRAISRRGMERKFRGKPAVS